MKLFDLGALSGSITKTMMQISIVNSAPISSVTFHYYRGEYYYLNKSRVMFIPNLSREKLLSQNISSNFF